MADHLEKGEATRKQGNKLYQNNHLKLGQFSSQQNP